MKESVKIATTLNRARTKTDSIELHVYIKEHWFTVTAYWKDGFTFKRRFNIDELRTMRGDAMEAFCVEAKQARIKHNEIQKNIEMHREKSDEKAEEKSKKKTLPIISSAWRWRW